MQKVEMLNNYWRQQNHETFDLFWENVITFVGMWLFLKIKNIVDLEKTCFFSLRMRNCAEIFHTSNVNARV